MVGGVCLIISIHQIPEMATSSISNWQSSLTKSLLHTHSPATPWVEGLLTLAHNGWSYPGHLKTSGRALRCTPSTNKPTNPPAHTPIHQPVNPRTHAPPTHAPIHPTSLALPTTPPPTHQPAPSSLCSPPLKDCPVYHHVESNPLIHQKIQIQSHITVLATPGWNGGSRLHTSISYVAHLKILGQAHRSSLPQQSTNPPTRAPSQPRSHPPSNPPIQQPIQPSTQPTTPCPSTHSPANQSASSSLCFAPIQDPCFSIMWKAIE